MERNKKKYVIIILILLLVYFTFPIDASAAEFERISTLKEIDLPEDLHFSINETCSDHNYFMQAAAREDGCFIVYSRYTDENGYSEDTFVKVYIDHFNADGKFIQELEFTSPLDLAVEITAQSINIYFYSSVLVYDLATQELRHYSIPEGDAVSGGIYTVLRKDTFTCGSWDYHCVKSFDGYTKLIRSNSGGTQVLVEMRGTGNNFWGVFFPGITVGIFLFALIITIRVKKRKAENRPSH